MPKLKTNRGAAKRFKRAANGRFKHRRAYRNHILTKKSNKQKRQLRAMKLVSKNDTNLVVRLLKRIFTR